MAQIFSAITIFCDDIRQEAGGTETIVGIYPDNINVPEFPFLLPKVGIYTRLAISLDFTLPQIDVVMKRTNGEQKLTTIESDLIASSIKESKQNGSPIFGIISRTLASPFPFEKPERIVICVKTGDYEILSGSLNVQQIPDQG